MSQGLPCRHHPQVAQPCRWDIIRTAVPLRLSDYSFNGRLTCQEGGVWSSIASGMSRRLLVALVSLIVAGGCAGISPTHTGQTVGTIAGAAIAPGIGAPIGALIGMLAGWLVQGEVDKVTEKRERKTLGDELATTPSAAPQEGTPLQGQSIRVLVDETVHDGRLVAGHFDVRSLQ